ncbi:MAG TPA: hypothetical protein VNK96_04415 [Fimbriimonadales bacterium]|nr:hypothetical protein [Fimbriimonadales bacterium]
MKWIKDFKLCLATLLLGVAVVGNAQGDNPTHRGQVARTGTNISATEPGPGAANLRWWYPLQKDVGKDVIVDNIDPGYITTGAWTTPSIDEESPDWYGTGTVPYQYAFVVAQSAGGADETAGWTANAQWVITGTPGTYYALYVWFPSSGTFVGGQLAPNADYAVYKIDYGQGQSFVDIVPHQGGGSWTRLGFKLDSSQPRIFQADPLTGQLRITLYNTVPRDENGNLMGETNNRIVCADAVLAVPLPGSIYASPVVKQLYDDPANIVAIAARNKAIPDPDDMDKTLQIETGEVTAINASEANPATLSLPRWTWTPGLSSNINLVFDNTNPAFNADLGWVDPGASGAPGFYGTNYLQAPVDLIYPGSAKAEWNPVLNDGNYYDIYVWFPGNGNGVQFARAARYVVYENGTPYEFFVNQEVGGKWVRIGNRSFLHDSLNGGLRLEVWNYSNDAGDAGRYVAADAAMFAGNYIAAIYSTPTLARVNIRKSNGVVEPTEVVIVCAEDGRIYCLDANGNAANGTTTVYWAYPSIPDVNDPNWKDPNETIDGPPGNQIPYPGSFGVSSPLVLNIGGKDLVVIAAANGRVYAIDAVGRGDYDPSTGKIGTTMREWTWPKAKYNSSNNTLELDPARPPFVSSVAFDIATSTIFAAGTEGRIFALDAAGNGDQTTTMKWAYPDLDEQPIGAISSTPAVRGQQVVFPSFDGRVYSRDTTGNTSSTLNWIYPAGNAPALSPFRYTSVCFIAASDLNDPVYNFDIVYMINENGYVYALRADTGTLVFSSNEGFGAHSSPYFTRLIPSGKATPAPVITFGTLNGAFLAFYADPDDTNSAGGRLAWGWQSKGTTVFASPAVSRGWMYHAGVDGYYYAFSTGGQISNDTGFGPPGQEIWTPDSAPSEYQDVRLKFISKSDYENLRNNIGDPAMMADIYPPPMRPALEWGQRLYCVAWNYPYQINGDPPPTIRFEVKGPGGINVRYDRQSQLVQGKNPNDPASGYAVVGIPFIASGANFLTPGDNITVSVTIIGQGGQYSPPTARRDVTVANPLALTTASSYAVVPPPAKSQGWTTNPSDPENLINGGPLGKKVGSSAGEIVHGQNGIGNFFIADRSRMIELTGTGLNNVRMVRGDGRWQGGSAAVFKPLPYLPPWEIMPDQIPNFSPDYPDVDRSQIDFVVEPFGKSVNPLLQAVQLPPPQNYDPNDPLSRIIVGAPVQQSWNIERYQPANLTPYVDAAGETLAGGYVAKAIVYVDSNNNQRPDGIEATLTQLPPSSRTEAYRDFDVMASVPVDERLTVLEPTIDLGALPHSLGYTPDAPWMSTNTFYPDISQGAPYAAFFQPFTLRNEGNVNMLDLRIATRIGQLPGPSYYSVAFLSAMNDPLAWLDGVMNIISNVNPPYAVNPYGGNVLDASGNPRVTLHKARAGDRAPTVLTVPDYPYGVTPPPNTQPVVGVAVPLGFPYGEYSQLVNVVEDNFLIGGFNDLAIMLDQNGKPLEAYSDPTFTLRFLNRETRLTGGVTTGSVPHIDNPLGVQTNFTWTNTRPTGVRDQLGNLHMSWHSNRPAIQNTPAGPQPIDRWSIFHSVLRGTRPDQTPPEAGSSPYRDLMAWIPMGTKFWNFFAGPEPTGMPDTLFGGTGGSVVGNPLYTEPAFAVNPLAFQATSNFDTMIFWTGTAQKDLNGDNLADNLDSRIFYRTYTMQPGAQQPSLGEVQWFVWDPNLEKKRLRPMLKVTGNRANWTVFWHAEVNGIERLFMNYLTQTLPGGGGDRTNYWSRNIMINPGSGFTDTWDPTPIDRTDGIDLVFTGLLKDSQQPEIYYAKYEANSQGRIGRLKTLPERNREILVRERNGNVYRSRGVNWEDDAPIEVWIQRPGQAPARIDIPNTRQEDPRTGVISFDAEIGGKIFCDPNTGAIRFSSGGPGSSAQVQLRYTPRVMRVSDWGETGGHSNPSSFIDNRNQWDRRYLFHADGSAVLDTEFVGVARFWHIYQRGASGPGQSKRPYMKTQRLAVNLAYSPALNQNGVLVNLTLSGATGIYQVDTANKKIYFTLQDEGRLVNVTYSYYDANGNLQQTTESNLPIQWLTEMTEQPLPIEQPVDEDSVYAFPDTFQHTASDPRAGLVWVYFSSSRTGSRDIYYLSLSPKLGLPK